MVTMAQVESGIARFVDREIISALPVSEVKRFGIGVAIAAAIKRGGKVAGKLKDNEFIQLLELVSTDGGVDVDFMAEVLKERIPTAGLRVDLSPIKARMPILKEIPDSLTFTAEDVDKLHKDIVG